MPFLIPSASRFCMSSLLIRKLFGSSAPNCFPSFFFHLAFLPLTPVVLGIFRRRIYSSQTLADHLQEEEPFSHCSQKPSSFSPPLPHILFLLFKSIIIFLGDISAPLPLVHLLVSVFLPLMSSFLSHLCFTFSCSCSFFILLFLLFFCFLFFLQLHLSSSSRLHHAISLPADCLHNMFSHFSPFFCDPPAAYNSPASCHLCPKAARYSGILPCCFPQGYSGPFPGCFLSGFWAPFPVSSGKPASLRLLLSKERTAALCFHTSFIAKLSASFSISFSK